MKANKYFLAVDIGNSNIVIAIFKEEKVISEFRIATSLEKTSDEIGILFLALLNNLNLDNSRNWFYGCAISSVVPRITGIVETALKTYLNLSPFIITAHAKIGIKLNVEGPGQVGSDRICNCAAAFNKYKSPIIIIDLGTAITFDVVSKKGEFLGGIIQPGPGTMVRALELKAAKLPSIDLNFPEKVIGRNTVTNIQSGILFGLVHSTKGLIKQIETELGEKCTVLLTGGYAKLISAKLDLKHKLEPDLLLEGIKMIYDKK